MHQQSIRTPSGAPPPSSPIFYAECPFCRNPPNLSWLGLSQPSKFILARDRHWAMLACIPSSVLFFSRPRSDGRPHHWRTFSIYLCPLSFWSTHPWGFLSTSWCCPSRPCAWSSSPACTWHCSGGLVLLRISTQPTHCPMFWQEQGDLSPSK